MYCEKCGNQLSGGSHFCGKCGARVDFTDTARQAAFAAHAEQQPTDSAPVARAMQQPTVNTAQSVSYRSPQAGAQGFIFDKGRAISEICFRAVIVGLLWATGFFLCCWFGGGLASLGSLTESRRVDAILHLALIYICTWLIIALCAAICETIVVRRRFKDPNDPGYKMGVMPDKEREKKFRRKHKFFLKMFDEVASVIILLDFVVFYMVFESLGLV